MFATGKSNHQTTCSYGIVRLLFITIILSFSVLIADTTTDSLYYAIEKYHGLPKIEARLKLSYYYRKNNLPESILQSQKAYLEAKKLGDIELQARANYYQGLAYHHNDLQDSALSYFNRSTELYKKDKNNAQLAKVLCMMGSSYLGVTGDQMQAIAHYNEALIYARKESDHSTMAMIYSQLSNIFRMNGAYRQAIEFIYKSKENYEAIGFHEGIAWVYYSIGRIYTTMSLYEEAQKKYKEGLEEYRRLPESVSSLKGQAICLDELGLTYLELGVPDKAKQYNLEARDIYKQIDSDFGMSNALKYLARIEYQAGNNEKAIEYLHESLNYKKKINDVLGFPGTYNLYGKILKQDKKYQEAIDSLNVGLRYAIQNTQMNRIVSINKCLADIYAETGDIENAYNYRTTEVTLLDSINQAKATRALTQLEDLYNLEIKEAKIKELERDNQVKEVNLKREVAVRNLLLIILAMIIVFTFFFMKLFASNRQTNEILKRNQKQLQELNATKDKFTSIIAHDLKSPFNALLGFSSLLMKYSDKGDFEKVKEFSGHINDVSNQTFKLLENLLEWSRSQTGKISFNPKALDIRIPVKDAMDLLHPAAKRKQINIIANVPTIAVLVDENMIHNVLQNLLSNAIKYSHHGSNIYIDAEEFTGNLILKVRDEGIGMDQDTLSKLFRIDETVSSVGTDGERGTGLGLILSKEFVERHRGKISVESTPNAGSCFTIELPL